MGDTSGRNAMRRRGDKLTKAQLIENDERRLMDQCNRSSRYRDKMRDEGFIEFRKYVPSEIISHVRRAVDKLASDFCQSKTAQVTPGSDTSTSAPRGHIGVSTSRGHNLDEIQLGIVIERIIEANFPVRSDVLPTLVAKEFQFKKAGPQFKKRMEPLLIDYPTTKEGHHSFYWKRGSDTSAFLSFRAIARPVAQISIMELASLAIECMSESSGDANVIEVMARRLGRKKMDNALRERLNMALEMATNWKQALLK